MRFDRELFESSIDKSTGPCRCWNWIGEIDRAGYGKLWFNGKLENVHRIAFYIESGSIPQNKHVKRTCGNMVCCNPSHMTVTNRTTKKQREDMEKMYSKGKTLQEIADVFGMSTSAPSRYIKIKRPRGRTSSMPQYCDVKWFMKQREMGKNDTTIASELGLSIQVVRLHRRKLKLPRCPAPTVEQRFWSKVTVGLPDECWEWQAGRTPAGYGRFSYNKKQWYAHRISWTLTYGAIPDGKHVLHRCDNTGCCNPSHLFIGTHLDNIHDRDEKGRGKIGIKGVSYGGGWKLTKDEVREIRRRYSIGGVTHKELAREFGVNPGSISRICLRKSYAWIE